MKTKILVFILFLVSFIGFSQDEKQQEGEQESADDLAQKLSNPTAAIGSLTLNLDYISYGGDLPDASGQSSFNLLFQPSLPKPLNIGFNLLFRPAIPINVQQPYFNGVEFENSGFGLGNIGFDLALGKTNEKGLLYLFGMVGSIPTASQKEVRGQWAFGPELLIGIVKKKFVGGLLLTQQWDVESGPRSTNILGGQYFYAIPIGKGQNIAAGPAYSYNWDTKDFTFPLGTGYNKVTSIGKTPFKWAIQVLYYAAKPDPFGPSWQIRLSLAPVVNLPW
jgi:hypothetical protein